MLNTTLRNGLMLLVWLYLISSVRAEEVLFLASQQRPQPEANQPWPTDRFLVLAYHDVENNAVDQHYLSVRTSALNKQIAWLLYHGYHAVSVQDVLDAHHGVKPLPAKAFLLSFDDSYSSFYIRVWPLLKAWNVPALWVPMGSRADIPAGQPVNFGGLITPRERFAIWEMVCELSRSSPVEIGTHTWTSHYGLPVNPQGSRESAAANRGWDKTTGRYESDAQFTRRMADDVQKVTVEIYEIAGKVPRTWVRSYGTTSGNTPVIVRQQRHQLASTLNDGPGNVKDPDSIPRMSIAGNPSIRTFVNTVTRIQGVDPVRVTYVDLDYVYDPNPVQQVKNIDKLAQHAYDTKISHVFLQAFSDPQGDGAVKSSYFPNRWSPMCADLFNFVSQQLQARGGVKVYAWTPVLVSGLSSDLPRAQRWDPQTGKALPVRQSYIHLSPWDPRVRQQIADIYEDLARHASFSGILFHDDAVLIDFEDVSPEAVAAWRQTGLRRDTGPASQRPRERQAWMCFKSQTLTRFTLDLRQAVQVIRGPQVKAARNLFALPILEPQSEAQFMQNLNGSFTAYDWTVSMAIPLMESVSIDVSQAWLMRLVQAVASHPGAPKKTIFELQARDWNRRQ